LLVKGMNIGFCFLCKLFVFLQLIGISLRSSKQEEKYTHNHR
jgi:Na+-transporting methylmalonyl-CoA/oxaloacetate decarboxylase gamma subunit